MTRRLALALLLVLLPAGALAVAKSKPVKRVRVVVAMPAGDWTLRVKTAAGREIVREGSARSAAIVLPGRKRPRSVQLDGDAVCSPAAAKAKRKGRTLVVRYACVRRGGAPGPGPGPDSQPQPEPTAIATAAPTTTAPPAATGPRPVTPYVDMTLGADANLPDLVEAKAQTGIPATTLGFITALGNQCKGAWDGRDVTATTGAFAAALRDRLRAFRAAGGQVVLAFGGLSGHDLAQRCDSVAATKAAYQQAIDAVSAQFGAPIDHIDLDVEHNAGAFSSDAAAVERQAKAIAQLQADNPALVVTYTVQAVPTRVHNDYNGRMMAVAHNAVRSAVANGMDIAAVNAMAMDYGSYYATGTEMGKDAISVAQTVRTSLGDLYPSRSDAQLWRMVGITVMIGRNDIVNEVTTPADVDELIAFARSKSMGLVGMWSTSRDKPCAAGVDTSVAQPTCHSMTGASAPAPWAFGKALAKFTA